MIVLYALVAGVIGVGVGMLLNMLADDLPLRHRVRPPHYPDGTSRPPSAWLGIAAFLSGQRTPPGQGESPIRESMPAASLGDSPDEPPASENLPVTPPRPARLRWRHPLLELATGLGFAGLVIGFSDEKNLWAWFVYWALLLLITVIDIEHRLILYAVIIPACAFALLVAAVSPPQGRAFGEFLIGGALGFGLFFVMFLGGGVFAAAARHNEVAFGFGDVMLATLSGLMLGWRAFIFASLITVFAGALGAVLYIFGRMLARRRYRWFTPLPYGPYIVIGTLAMLLFREEIGELLKASVY